MNFDDTLLLAYVDGELPPSRHAEVERAIETSPDLASRVADLRGSVLPYRDAFAHQPMPPVPESLASFVAQLVRDGAPSVGINGHDAHEGRDDAFARRAEETDRASELDEPVSSAPADSEDSPERAEPVNVVAKDRETLRLVHSLSARPAPPLRRPSAWLAAAFVAGAFFCGAALKVSPHLLSFEPRVTPWVEAAAGYQELFSRETLSDLGDESAVNTRVLDAIHQQDGLPVTVPDLQNVGLTFKRLQRLRFHGKPLVQIVYLPEHGAPVALCVVGNQLADQAAQDQRVYGMDVVVWNKDKLGYALIGKRTDVDLPAIARQIADNPGNAVVGQTGINSAIPRSSIRVESLAAARVYTEVE
jgi:anti-sigma factor RsiW